MDTNAASTSANEEGDEVVAVSDLISYQDDMMENVAAVLGGADDLNCTYNQGYVKRQPLYACLTCIPEAKEDFNKSAGICLACSYNCHDGHTLIELYTKRKFCCDCGNKKFENSSCSLQKEKTDFNELNAYNQNFKGIYCVCSKPYPDPEDPIDDEMTQCVVCEDWFHSRHLGVPVPTTYAEMICFICVKAHEFLLNYEHLTINVVTKTDGEAANVEVVDGADASKEVKENDAPISNQEQVTSIGGTEESVCMKPKTQSTEVTTKFMENFNWRQKLCKCPACLEMYEKKKISFLIDPLDPVQVYEEKGKEKFNEMKAKAEEAEVSMLNSMDRVQLMEVLTGYNEFKEQLTDYLKKFAENKKIIRLEDIEEFFSDLKSRKKQKTEMQYFCR